MEYRDRTYRKDADKERWHSFTIIWKESDLWIGVNRDSFDPRIPDFALQRVKKLRSSMDRYIEQDPNYRTSLVTYPAKDNAPEIFREMSAVAQQSGIGPMSAVAGAVAEKIGREIKKRFDLKEIIVENGGDIYVESVEDVDITVFAGASPLSEKVGFHIPAERTPLGICTSSGTVGPSLSFGKADAVMIIAKNCALADTYATAFANLIQSSDDINSTIEVISKRDDILGAICIKDDKIGIWGEFELIIRK